jgi:hypothetical protein
MKIAPMLVFFLITALLPAQQNSLSVYAVGNLNTWNFTYIPGRRRRVCAEVDG